MSCGEVPSAGPEVRLPSTLRFRPQPGVLASCHFLCYPLSTILWLSPLLPERGMMGVISKKEAGFQIPEGFVGAVGGKNGNRDSLLTMTYGDEGPFMASFWMMSSSAHVLLTGHCGQALGAWELAWQGSIEQAVKVGVEG